MYIRPSWADTIKTFEYFGEKVPIQNPGGALNVFPYPDKNVDLSCILFFPYKFSQVYLSAKDNRKMHPYNQVTTPHIGDEVWIGGYPDHIENIFGNTFPYDIGTFKLGTIAWKPFINMENSDLNHIILVESNATYSNSGGPVFSAESDLVGILVSGNYNIDTVYLNGKEVHEQTSGLPYTTQSRAGVSVIERAEFIKKLIEYVQTALNNSISLKRMQKKEIFVDAN